jgi:hypothetical protein
MATKYLHSGIGELFPDSRLSLNFMFGEFIRSPMATKLGIVNYPSEAVFDDVFNNLTQLCRTLLQPIRDHYRHAVFVNSGYRCRQLNAAVGGVSRSRHMSGRAADITASDFISFAKCVAKLVDSRVIKPAEIIFHDTYIHIAI